MNVAVNGPPDAACLTTTIYVPPAFIFVNEKVVFAPNVYVSIFELLKFIVVLVVVVPPALAVVQT